MENVLEGKSAFEQVVSLVLQFSCYVIEYFISVMYTRNSHIIRFVIFLIR